LAAALMHPGEQVRQRHRAGFVSPALARCRRHRANDRTILLGLPINGDGLTLLRLLGLCSLARSVPSRLRRPAAAPTPASELTTQDSGMILFVRSQQIVRACLRRPEPALGAGDFSGRRGIENRIGIYKNWDAVVVPPGGGGELA